MNNLNVGRVANLRPIVNRPSDGGRDDSTILNNLQEAHSAHGGRLAIGRRLATRPTAKLLT
jgi:hypothetical protein